MIKAVILDADGVIDIGDCAPASAEAVLEQIRRCGWRIRIYTNDTYNSRRTRCCQLRSLGLTLDAREVYTASYFTADYLRTRRVKDYLVLGGGAVLEEFDGIATTREGERWVVVADFFEYYDLTRVNQALQWLLEDAFLVAGQRKPFWHDAGRPRVDVGFWVAAFEYASGKKAEVVGKPSSYGYLKILADLEATAAEVVFVSDEVFPDLVGAKAVGMWTVLVGQEEEGTLQGQVDFACASIEGLPDVIALADRKSALR